MEIYNKLPKVLQEIVIQKLHQEMFHETLKQIRIDLYCPCGSRKNINYSTNCKVVCKKCYNRSKNNRNFRNCYYHISDIAIIHHFIYQNMKLNNAHDDYNEVRYDVYKQLKTV